MVNYTGYHSKWNRSCQVGDIAQILHLPSFTAGTVQGLRVKNSSKPEIIELRDHSKVMPVSRGLVTRCVDARVATEYMPVIN